KFSDTVSPTPSPMTMAQNSPSSSPSSPSPSATLSGPGTMPNLIGLTVDQASTRLTKNMQIGSVDVGAKPPNAEKAMTIYFQNPSANSKIDGNKVVTVTVKAYGSAKQEAAATPPPDNGGGDPFANAMNEIDKKYQHYTSDFNKVGAQIGKR